VEHRLAHLEGTEDAVLFASGMAAISQTVLAVCAPAGHLLTGVEQYGGTSEFLQKEATALGIEVEFVPSADLGTLASRVRENTRLVFLESPSNPLMHLVDFQALFAGLGEPRPLVAVDATLATPLGQDSVGAGFDLVLHSATKYLGGHDDLVAGVVLGSRDLLAPIREKRRILGATCDPQTAWLLDRGLKTLSVRWERQCANALALARRLADHPAVRRVHYPGLENHPHHAVARRQMRSTGALLSFEVEDSTDEARRVLNRLSLIARAPSLGGVETMALHPTFASHRTLTPEERRAVGIADGLIRLSVGIEDVEDLWADLEHALER
jgi:cystathionine beta-lyase/cystathionine gamma-synthase